MSDWLDEETLQRIRDILPGRARRLMTLVFGLGSWLYFVGSLFLRLTEV